MDEPSPPRDAVVSDDTKIFDRGRRGKHTHTHTMVGICKLVSRHFSERWYKKRRYVSYTACSVIISSYIDVQSVPSGFTFCSLIGVPQ